MTYEALSYACGDAQDLVPLCVNDSSHIIAFSLYLLCLELSEGNVDRNDALQESRETYSSWTEMNNRFSSTLE